MFIVSMVLKTFFLLFLKYITIMIYHETPIFSNSHLRAFMILENVSLLHNSDCSWSTTKSARMLLSDSTNHWVLAFMRTIWSFGEFDS